MGTAQESLPHPGRSGSEPRLNTSIPFTHREGYLVCVAFVSGAAVMGIEISAGRLMAPFFGTSLLVWTVIIGSAMIALMFGYYVGGIVAEKRPEISLARETASFTSWLNRSARSVSLRKQPNETTEPNRRPWSCDWLC